MRELILHGKRSDLVRRLAIAARRGLPRTDALGQIAACFYFVRRNIEFVFDPRGIEKLSTARQIIADGAGDCDDMVILLGSMLESIGIRTQCVAMAFRGAELSHVVLQAWAGGQWITLDPTEPYPPGWTPPGITLTMSIENVEVV